MKKIKYGIILIILIFTCFIVLFTTKNSHNKEYKELFGQFYESNGSIYVNGSEDKYLLANADIKTFRAINDEYYDKHIAIDKNNVYCGNNN
nr:DKNYY domain-containing protein [Oceanivirga salmonicida]